MSKKCKAIALGVVGSITAFATNSFAVVDLTGVTVDTSAWEAGALLVIGAFAVIWGGRRVIGLFAK